MFVKRRALQFLYWVITGIFIFLFIFLLVKLFPFYSAFFSFLWSVLSPFIIAGLIAYFLHPVVKKLNELNFPRSIAIILIYLIFFGGGTYLIYRFYPAFVLQLRDFNEHLPELLEMYESIIYQIYASTSWLPETVHTKIDHVITGLEAELEAFIGKLIESITKVFSMVVWLTVIPVLVFYFLKDYQILKKGIQRLIPKRYLPDCVKLIQAMNDSLGGYIRGQLLVSFIVAMVTYLIFHILGMNYPLLLGIIMGLTNIIPYFGPIIGSIPVVLIAITISGKMVIYALLAVFLIQLIEGNFLSPYIVGKSTELHPVMIIFALLFGGQLGGIIGMILAVPILTVVKVMANYALGS
ncbi:MAG TPA: AI-2E family transporter [Cerasibacillus sp.]|uniref:AI-2E family transporter n=1 Tax=Cerasibacillus sp. TaxID=2498711 RepID=UPI002F42838E